MSSNEFSTRLKQAMSEAGMNQADVIHSAAQHDKSWEKPGKPVRQRENYAAPRCHGTTRAHSGRRCRLAFRKYPNSASADALPYASSRAA